MKNPRLGDRLCECLLHRSARTRKRYIEAVKKRSRNGKEKSVMYLSVSKRFCRIILLHDEG